MLLIDLNIKNQYLLIRNSDENNLYIKIDQKNATNNNTLFVCLPHPPNAANTDTPPLRVVWQ